MFTKSVAACILSGALVGAMLPGGPCVTAVHAKRLAVKRTAKVSRVPQSVHKTASPVSPRRQSSPPTKTARIVASTTAPSTPVSFAHGGHRKTSVRHLGTFTVRAYTHYRSHSAVPGKTATGTTPTTGRTVAVDPRVIPLGSKIHIEGVGERIAEDTGGKIKGKKLDLFLPSTQDCRQFGVQQQNVYLLAE